MTTHPRCDALLPLVSRTFALPIQALPDPLRAAIQTAYLLCRLVDSIEDQPGLDPRLRQELFGAFDDAMRGQRDPLLALLGALRLGSTEGEVRLCESAGILLDDLARLPEAQRQAIRDPILEMSSGMRTYSARWDAQGTLRVSDVPELERYCYYVAGTVGLLLDRLFELEATSQLPLPERRTLAVHFGIGLQLVNVLKDIAEDAERQVCYVPETLLTAWGLSTESLLAAENRASGMAMVASLQKLARTRLSAAARYTRSWEGADGQPVRAFCALPLLLAVHTLEAIASGEDTLRPGRNPRISRRRVAALVTAVRAARGERRMRVLLSSAGL